MTGEGCPPFVGVDRPFEPFCRALNDFYLKTIIALRPDVVVISAAWYEQGVAPIAQTLQRLREAGVTNVVVIGPVPPWPMMVKCPIISGPTTMLRCRKMS
jgi:hypothetical protein